MVITHYHNTTTLYQLTSLCYMVLKVCNKLLSEDAMVRDDVRGDEHHIIIP